MLSSWYLYYVLLTHNIIMMMLPNRDLIIYILIRMNDKVNPFVRELSFSDMVGFKCIHISFWVCWFGLIVAGTTIIGYGASNYSLTFNYCADS